MVRAMSSVEKVKDEYPEDFCSLLEAAYGKGFLSEGGTEAIDDIAEGSERSIAGGMVLDIGCGFGGAAQHLARKHGASVTGLEINRAMVDEAARRVPPELGGSVRFLFYDDVRHLPFSDASFDFAFTKEVLLHLDAGERLSIMTEVARVLRPGGVFAIVEWMSPEGGWGPRVLQVAEADGLTLHAGTEQEYRSIASAAGLELLSVGSRSAAYAAYNREVAAHLGGMDVRRQLERTFSEEYIERSISEYRLLSQAMADGELQVRKMVFLNPGHRGSRARR
jgi:SAM-dependent methyltransferase